MMVALLIEKTGSRAAFLADQDGLALAARDCSDDEVAISAAITEALRPVRVLLEDGQDRSLVLELDAEYLHLVWAQHGTRTSHRRAVLFASTGRGSGTRCPQNDQPDTPPDQGERGWTS